MDQKNIRLILAYDGTRYHGWQRQKNQKTIQEVVEHSIQIITGEQVKLFASGRTDAGVHALNQVCNFTTRSTVPLLAMQKGLNSLLPDDILVKSVDYVPHTFHSRYSARTKIYEYRILNRDSPDIFRRHFLWHIRLPLDIGKMNDCISLLTGTRDFSSFMSAGSGTTSAVRTVSRAEIKGPDQDLFRIVIEADGFLRHMVRNIVGTAVEAGLGRISQERFREIIDLKDRKTAGPKAPARGLFLVEVRY